MLRAHRENERLPGIRPAVLFPGAKRVSSGSADSASRATPTVPGSGELGIDGWKIYRNTGLGYSLHNPPDATIGNSDDPDRTLTITGPSVGNAQWPVIYLSHPSDRVEYRPPEGVDLDKWLKEHDLLMTGGTLGEVRQGDIQLAGTRAVHIRLARSPQTYAIDKHYFAKSEQLYVLVILHTGDREDWGLYNHLIESIRF